MQKCAGHIVHTNINRRTKLIFSGYRDKKIEADIDHQFNGLKSFSTDLYQTTYLY